MIFKQLRTEQYELQMKMSGTIELLRRPDETTIVLCALSSVVIGTTVITSHFCLDMD